jgi:hypothetical protein
VEVAPAPEPAEPARAAAAAEPEPVIDLTEPPPTPAATVVPPVSVEPDDEHVDQILRALVRLARERHVAVADVAVELVEQAELEDRDIDEVLADLVAKSPTGEPVDDAITIVEEDDVEIYDVDSAHRAGRLVNLDELDTTEKKRIIVRVLCLLVALQESSGERRARESSADDDRASTRLG